MLGPNQNFYGIQVPSDRRNAKFASIKEMSKHYVNELVKFQPEGAFFLGGYSIGATIALEMAQQLIARGREVGLLVVFDGELFNTGAEISVRNPVYWLKLLANVPRWIIDELVRNRRRFAGKTANRVKSVTIKVRRRNMPNPHAVERFIDLKGFLPEHSAFIKALFDDQQAYVPTRYPGRVLVFIAKTHALLHLRQVKAAWTKIAPSSEVSEVSGTHVSIMTMPRGQILAERLREKIREIDKYFGAAHGRIQ
jgi:thioesterase domain-containing protein